MALSKRQTTPTHSVLFQKPSLDQIKKKLLDKVPEDLQDFVRERFEEIDKENLSEDKKCVYAQNVVSNIVRQADSIRKLAAQPDLVQEIYDTYSDPQKKHNPAPSLLNRLASVFPQFMKTAAMTALNNIPVVTAAFANAAYRVFSGIPAGGGDNCGANILYCKQGYLEDSQNNLISTFSSTLYPGGAKNNNDLLFLTCMDINKIGNTIGQFLTSMGLNGTESCAANSVPYYLSTMAVEATNLPEGSCPAFQQAFTSVFENCMNSSSSLGIIIGASVAGGVVGVALCVAAAYFIAKGCNSKCCSNPF